MALNTQTGKTNVKGDHLYCLTVDYSFIVMLSRFSNLLITGQSIQQKKKEKRVLYTTALKHVSTSLIMYSSVYQILRVSRRKNILTKEKIS
jgi:hypothetical protein